MLDKWTIHIFRTKAGRWSASITEDGTVIERVILKVATIRLWREMMQEGFFVRHHFQNFDREWWMLEKEVQIQMV